MAADDEMRINPQRAAELIENLTLVSQKVQTASQKATKKPVRLVAVSKLKPATDILALHQQASTPHLHFGENYTQELEEKAKLLPRSIRWHMIGALQTNKCKALAERVGNLWCVESVDTSKKADQLEKGRAKHGDGEKLRVFVQVNTSGEEEKSGCEPGETLELCKHIREKCEHLQLQGLMTIGAIARSRATTEGNENEDFVTLRDVRDRVAKELGVELELSMGMSADYEGAIAMGSDEVRVGSTVFGERPPKKEAKILEDTEDSKP